MSSHPVAAEPRDHALYAARPARPVACFAVAGRPEPGLMPRVLEQFAKRDLVPSRWHAVVEAAPAGEDAELVIDIQMPGLDADQVMLIAACLRQIVGINHVLVSEKDGGDRPRRWP